ncbi:MAG: hypothetical protein GX163_10015 [Bacteroidetes bacterium]|nr:hypothetical protein [Bacteroidota bacterium]
MQEVDNSWFWVNHNLGNHGFGGGSGSSSSFGNSQTGYGLPGFGGNGTGLNGFYFDHTSFFYRSVSDPSLIVPWSIVSSMLTPYLSDASFLLDPYKATYSTRKMLDDSNRTGSFFFSYDPGSRKFFIPHTNKIIPDILAAYAAHLNNVIIGGGGNAAGGGANAWDYISNGASVASGYPTISGTWAYNTSGDVAWTGKNGNYYKLSQVKNNGGYVKSMNYAKNASRLTRGLGSGLTYISIGATTVSTINAVANGTDNTSTWTNVAIGIGGGVLTIVGAPVVVTGAAIVGVVWGVGQLFYGDEINGWLDNNFGYR